MRIMWTVFVTFPEVADKIGKKSEYACTWARALAAKLRYREDIQLAIVSVADEDTVKKFHVDNVDFYFLPNGKEVMRSGGGEKIQDSWKYIISDFKPDLVHIHGSESMVPYELIKMKPDVPLLLTLQGILSNYYKDAYAGMEMKDVIRTYSLRDVVRHSGIIWDRKKEIKRSGYEKEMLKGIQYIGGRTTWDKVSSLAVNPEAKYIYAPELIRPEFYQSTRWNVNNIERHRIFMHQGFKPIKGLHIVLDAMKVLKKKYPDVELYMSGRNVMKNSTIKEKLLQPGYVKYLFEKIQANDLQDCIHFTGILDAEQIVSELKKSNVMVLPSAIENSPNSLCEAQLVGIPCVASFVGGVPEMLRDGKDGYLYTFNEPLMLAEYISRIFDSDSLAEQFSMSSYEWIRSRQGENDVVNKTINNYKTIIDDWKNKL